jgi:hypothetical protein
MVSGFGGLYSMDFCSRRLADHTAATAIVQAKLNDIMAATYNPPNANFGSTTTWKTNTDSVSLDRAGTTLRVSGTLISEIKPVGSSSHLITVTGTFQEPRGAIVVRLQTVVNKYSAGQYQ